MTPLTTTQLTNLVDALTACWYAERGDGANYGAGDNTLTTVNGSNVPQDVAGAGTISSSGRMVTGSGTTFLTAVNTGKPPFKVGDPIKSGSQVRFIQMIIDNTHLVVDSAPSPAWSAAAYSLAADWGASGKAKTLQGIAMALGDFTLVQAVGGGVNNLLGVVPQQKIGLYAFRLVMAGLLNACYKSGITLGISTIQSIDSFAAYYNVLAGGPYTCLLPPDFAILHNLIYGSLPTAYNVYAPAIDNLGQFVVGSGFTAGQATDSSRFAGQGRIQAVITGFSGSGGTLTVTGMARKADGTTASGRTWTATIVGNSGGLALTPTVAGDLCVSATGMSLPGTMSAGTVVVQGLVPTGRVNPPV